VLFVLLGLKCCAILSGIPVAYISDYFHQVIVQSAIGTELDARLRIASVGLVRTPAFELAGQLIVLNQKHKLYEHATRILDLRDIASAIDVQGEFQDVSEDEIATLLDYPVALSSCLNSSMIEVTNEYA